MLRKIFMSTFICSLVFLLGVSLVFSDNPAFWNKSEGANNVAEDASDSGSFCFVDGCYFTTIYTSAEVKNGDMGTYMTAVAHIEISTSDDAHAEVYSNGSESASSEETLTEEDDINSCTWYWTIDTRNNVGTGSAWCRWRWSYN